MHMYTDVAVITNQRNGEKSVHIQSVNEIKAILNRYEYPYSVIKTNQSEVDQNMLWLTSKEYTNKFDFPIESAKNVFRQQNSLMLAYEAARRWDPDIFIFARSDTLLISKTRIPSVPFDILIPGWHYWPGHEYNDRFAICSRKGAELYSKRGSYYEEAVKTEKYVHNGERLTYKFLDKHRNEFKIRVMEFKMVNLLRIRGDGTIAKRDVDTFKVKNASKLLKDEVDSY